MVVTPLSDVPVCWSGKCDQGMRHDHCPVVRMIVTTLPWHDRVTSHVVVVVVEAAVASKAGFVVIPSSCF